MSRVPGYTNAASLGQTIMTSTVQCPECGVVLNVPASAAGRKLRCPKCATKFAAPAAGSSIGPADSAFAGPGPDSTMFPTRKGPASSGDLDLPARRGSSGSIDLPTSRPAGGGGHGDFDLPTASGPLRETFDLPLLAEASPKSSPAQGKAPADALALFQDEPKANRKLQGAEARAKVRRCPGCGGVVGVGMSLCNTCGLDLDTGRRVDVLDVLDDEMPSAPVSDMPPMGVLFVGGLTAMINLLLSVISLVAWAKGEGGGFLFLLVVFAFGIYASTQFLRRKAIRPLFLALGLAVGIGVVYLIVLPIWEANVESDAAPVNPGIASPADPFDPDAPRITNLADRLDMNKITWGIAVLLSYAALSVYLNSPGVKRQFNKR